MRYIPLFILPLLLAFTIVKEKYPLIVLEQKYAQGKAGEKIEYYKIKATKGIRVDPRRIRFEEIDTYRMIKRRSIPLKIYVVDQGALYEAPFYADKIMTLDATQLTNTDGVTKFPGFKTGYAYVIGVGEVKKEGKEESSVLTAWSTVVKVVE